MYCFCKLQNKGSDTSCYCSPRDVREKWEKKEGDILIVNANARNEVI